MKKAAGIEKDRATIGELEKEAIMEGTSQAGIGILIALAALIGVWGLACLAGGIANGGVVELLRGWVNAVSGM